MYSGDGKARPYNSKTSCRGGHRRGTTISCPGRGPLAGFEWTTDEASSGTEDSSSQKVSPGWGSSYRHPPRAEMPSGPVVTAIHSAVSSAGPPLLQRSHSRCLKRSEERRVGKE